METETQPTNEITEAIKNIAVKTPELSDREHQYIQASLTGFMANLGAGILTGQVDGPQIVNVAITVGRSAYKAATQNVQIKPPVILPPNAPMINENGKV